MQGPTVRVPGDKSITHRAWILAALASGDSTLRGLLDSADTRSTARALARLGVDWEVEDSDTVRVHGGGLHCLGPNQQTLDCGNSGTTARLLLGALAGTRGQAVLTGDASLRSRPMRRVTEPLSRAGAGFAELGGEGCLPIRVAGSRPLRALRHDSPHASAQVKSALLLAGLCGDAAVTVTEPGRSRDHTERLLRAMGAVLHETTDGDRVVHELEPPASIDPLDLTIPGDISSAVFFLVLGALVGPLRVEGVGLNPGRTGALAVLERMGVGVWTRTEGDAGPEPVGVVGVDPGGMRGTVIEPGEVPGLLDEVPALAAAAAVAEGETRFLGIGELRVKETDRIAAIASNLRALGVEIEEGPDSLTVVGRPGRPLEGTVEAFGDHRIAMAFGVLGAAPGNHIDIHGRDAVDISYPGFWADLERVRQELSQT